MSNPGLEAYLQAIERMPTLSLEDERVLIVRMHQHADFEAEAAVIKANLRHVVKVARDYEKYQQPAEDLIQEGTIGLIKALHRFSAESGVPLISVATRSIHLELCRFVLRNWRTLTAEISKEQVRLFLRMRRFKRGRQVLTRPEIKAVAANLSVRPLDIERLEDRLSGEGVSLDAMLPTRKALPIFSQYLIDRNDEIEALEDRQWNEWMIEQLGVALSTLDERSRDMIQSRWLEGERTASLRKVSTTFGISGERVRQIQRRAFNRLREQIGERPLSRSTT